MRVVDTSAWVEWTLGSALGRSLSGELPTKDRWVVPTIVQFELARWAARASTAQVAEGIAAFASKCVVAPLFTPIAMHAAALARRHSLAAADSIVLATAVEYGADLLTCDAHFKGLPNVAYFERRLH